MDGQGDEQDLDDDTGPIYREAYNLTRDRIGSADLRTYRRDPADQLAQLRRRLARNLGDAARPALEALDAGVKDAEAGMRPAW